MHHPIIAFILVVLTAAIADFLVRPLLALIRKSIRVPYPSDSESINRDWERLTTHPDWSGRWVGTCERLIMFGALFYLQPRDAGTAIGIWLAFKVASKWDAWSHMAKVPDSIEGIDDLRFAAARRIWSAQAYATFVVGTTVNFLLGLAAATLICGGWCSLDAPKSALIP